MDSNHLFFRYSQYSSPISAHEYHRTLCVFEYMNMSITEHVFVWQELALGWTFLRVRGVCSDVSSAVSSSWPGWSLHVPVEWWQLWNQEQLYLQVHQRLGKGVFLRSLSHVKWYLKACSLLFFMNLCSPGRHNVMFQINLRHVFLQKMEH